MTGSSSSVQNVSNTPLMNMYRGLKFVPKFGSRNRMSPAVSTENIYQSTLSSSQHTSRVINTTVATKSAGLGGTATSKPPTPPSAVAYSASVKRVVKKTTPSESQQVNNLLAHKVESLKINSSQSSSSKLSRSNFSSSSQVNVNHQPVIVQANQNRTVLKSNASHLPRAVPVVVGAPVFHTQARALKRQESASSISSDTTTTTTKTTKTTMSTTFKQHHEIRKPSGSSLVKSSTFSMGRSSSQTSLVGTKTTLAVIAKMRSKPVSCLPKPPSSGNIH